MDMVTLSVIDSSMVSICREMGISLMKTSYSTVFNEGLDFTCALADKNGDMIAVAEFCPAQIGGMPLLIKTCAEEFPIESLDKGDVLIHNDPHRGGLHVPEHTLFKPFFFNGEALGYLVCIGHIAEVGGMVPGGFAGEATEIFHEGMRVPPIKIKKAGKDVDSVWKLMLANVRTPRHNYGDLRAMIGSLDLGEIRIAELLNKYGKRTFVDTCQNLMDYSERRMRSEISLFPDGHYSFSDTIESEQVAYVIRDVYYDLINNIEIPEHRKLITLTALGSTSTPTHMQIPDGIRRIEEVRYNQVKSGATAKDYNRISWMEPEAFLQLSLSRNSTDSTIVTVAVDGGEVLISNNKAPDHYTTFDDSFLIFDSYDSAVDSTLQSSKFIVWAIQEPTFTMSDTFIPDLDVDVFPWFLNEAKSVAHVEINQRANPKAEQVSLRQKIRWQSDRHNIAASQSNYYGRVDYGRTSRRRS